MSLAAPPAWDSPLLAVCGRTGAFVAVSGFNSKDFASLAAEFSSHRICLKVDVTVEATVATVLATLSQINLLVNGAGVTGRTNVEWHEVSPEDFEFVQRINVRGCFLTAKHVLPATQRQSDGCILHIPSIAGKEDNEGMLAYSAAKAAIIGMTKVQGKEYASAGITVNALAPAMIRTPMVAALPDTRVKYMTDKIPMQRCGTLDEAPATGDFHRVTRGKIHHRFHLRSQRRPRGILMVLPPGLTANPSITFPHNAHPRGRFLRSDSSIWRRCGNHSDRTNSRADQLG